MGENGEIVEFVNNLGVLSKPEDGELAKLYEEYKESESINVLDLRECKTTININDLSITCPNENTMYKLKLVKIP